MLPEFKFSSYLKNREDDEISHGFTSFCVYWGEGTRDYLTVLFNLEWIKQLQVQHARLQNVGKVTLVHDFTEDLMSSCMQKCFVNNETLHK